MFKMCLVVSFVTISNSAQEPLFIGTCLLSCLYNSLFSSIICKILIFVVQQVSFLQKFAGFNRL